MKLQDYHRTVKIKYVDSDVWVSVSDSPKFLADKAKVLKALLIRDYLTIRQINERFVTPYLADILLDLQGEGLIEIDTKNPLITKYRKLPEKAEPVKEKRCSRCLETKDLDKFHYAERSAQGRDAWCKQCRYEYNKSKNFNNKPLAGKSNIPDLGIH